MAVWLRWPSGSSGFDGGIHLWRAFAARFGVIKALRRGYAASPVSKGESEMKDSVAYCGLFCESCGVYIATQNKDDKELERIAQKMKTKKEDIPCEGCRSKVLSLHCRSCKYREYAQNKEIDNCEECHDFPCDELREFQGQMPHRAELFESARFRKEKGVTQWLEKMKEDYSCESCGFINSPYYIICKKCGNDPGNKFIRRNISLLKK